MEILILVYSLYNLALTGGLAAPLLAPLLVGVTGATFFATAGGIALVTSLFGLTGGGLAGWKMHKRMKGLEEFEFKQILNDPDLPPVPTLHCTICISGFYLDSKDEARVISVFPHVLSYFINKFSFL